MLTTFTVADPAVHAELTHRRQQFLAEAAQRRQRRELSRAGLVGRATEVVRARFRAADDSGAGHAVCSPRTA